MPLGMHIELSQDVREVPKAIPVILEVTHTPPSGWFPGKRCNLLSVNGVSHESKHAAQGVILRPCGYLR